MKKLLAASLLSANFGNLEHDIDIINRSEADWLHIDVMDGVFVPNISFGFPVLKYVKALSKKPLDVHLMIVEPDKFINEVKAIGAILMNVHYEACPHLHRTIQRIHAAGMQAGVTLNPHTPVEVLEDIINDVDLVLLMSVNPGFGGQSFIENTYNKIARLKKMIERRGSKALIQVDGGVSTENAAQLYAAGADCLVAGSAVFGSDDIMATIRKMKR
ncbi:MAG: ribulose-phosphate 3-epimerase [Paludibacteraceae bacterium]|jgi:ribulose-phosphate 3-epimerase|nr:ribulose-phosphate 3-epimerase [Paludibacteraceae bacterium]MDI9537560.1 ribulose-phosphate 3-epimerase [Bacteroidota bacterium]HHT61091.1 ribulose-phosphate 3-epimerase [Bacteroidales bacterium]HOA47066.1 ribulose-phosphate 3-epimerase [Paludibacteraceae bacterium]HOG35992.1 ribulose-phosphate 3-epimerase [Paludibacteraceae bacterium]